MSREVRTEEDEAMAVRVYMTYQSSGRSTVGLRTGIEPNVRSSVRAVLANALDVERIFCAVGLPVFGALR